MPTRTKRSKEIEAARALFDHVRVAAAVASAARRNTSMLVPGHSFGVRIAAGSPSGLGKWLLREAGARRSHGSRGLVVPIDGRYGTTSRSRWAFAQGSPCPGNSRVRGSLGVTSYGDAEIPACAGVASAIGLTKR
jgi:hypothetical protein